MNNLIKPEMLLAIQKGLEELNVIHQIQNIKLSGQLKNIVICELNKVLAQSNPRKQFSVPEFHLHRN